MCSKNQLHNLLEKLNVGLPTCPLPNFEDVRSRIGEINCWNVGQYFGQGESGSVPSATTEDVQAKVTTTQPTNLQKFYKKHKKMPAFRGRRGWCGCFQDDEPPEICVVAQGVVPLQTVTPTQPMPSVDELDAKFAELVEELDLTAPNKVAMLNLPAQKKWQIYCSRKNPCDEPVDGQVVASGPTTPEQYIEWLRDIINQLKVSPDDSPSHEYSSKLETHVVHVDGLKTALRTSTHSFVLRFIELQGLNALLDLLENLDHRLANSNLHTSLIGCIKALMNNSTGRAHVLSHKSSINTIAQSLAADNIKTKVAALEILGAVCLVPGGHKTVLKAMLHFQEFSGERTRFQGVMNDLDRSTGAYRDEVSLKTAIMSFINAVLNYGPGQHNLEFRLHLRYEFIMLGMEPIIVKLRKHENETLDRHLDFFEMVRNEDEKEFSRKFNEEHVDAKSATAMFDLLRRKLSHSSGYQYLLSLLQHLLLLPFTGNTSQYWLMFDRIVQQIVLQQDGSRPNSLVEGSDNNISENGNKTGTHDPDVNPIVIDVKKVIKLLVKEEELVAARTRADELEKENLEMQVKLAKREQDLDLRQQEKEDLETNLKRMRERLEKESASHTQAVQRALNAEMRAEELQHKYDQERLRLERLVTEGSIPDDQKVAGLQGTSNGSLSPQKATSPIPPPPKLILAPPPPPPGLPGPPPPMPPMMGGMPSLVPNKVELPKKNIPPSSNPLKSFNWSKLPDAKVNGTIWSELDESKLYNSMDLESVDKLFCAYLKNGVQQTIQTDGSIEEDLKLIGKGKPKVVSVIDGRRAQNCTILLSKLKMSDDEICKLIMSMDINEQIPIDMVEQMLKFTPLAEERALLDEHSDDIESLGRADRFLFEISKINHYEQRLRSLHYKKRFQLTINEVMPRLTNVMEASREVARSRRLRKLLEIVLALGNYMNRGARGNASGFRLASLNRLVDTKSSSSKGTTLLHYLVQVVETKHKDVLKLDEDLPHVRDGAKVSMGEMEKDIAMLRNGLAEVSREIEFHRGAGTAQTGDKFLSVMCEFQAQASVRLTELEDKFQDMKTRFDRAVRLFGEDGSVIQPDEFFGIFDTFLASFMEARNDNEAIKKRQEEEEKRAKQEAEMKKRTIDRKSKDGLLSSMAKNLGLKSSPNKNETANKGEFDDLISALRTGDVFGEDKFKRSRKPKGHSANSVGAPANATVAYDTRERSGSRH